jgi:hypothetical protein
MLFSIESCVVRPNVYIANAYIAKALTASAALNAISAALKAKGAPPT